MGCLKIFFGVIVVVYVVFVWLVSFDVKKCGDDVGKWIVLIFFIGVVGVVKYVCDGC